MNVVSESSIQTTGVTLVLARDRDQFSRWRAAEGVDPLESRVMWVPTVRMLKRALADQRRRPRVIRLHRWHEGFTARERIQIETLLDPDEEPL